MSDEQKSKLPAKSTRNTPKHIEPKQAEREIKRAQVIHPDGRQADLEIHSERSWSGVLPRPEDLAKFGEIVPDAPERLLKMAELEQQHRIALERLIFPENVKAGTRGQWLGAAISILALVLASVTAWAGGPWQVSLGLVSVPVFSVARSLVTAFRADHD